MFKQIGESAQAHPCPGIEGIKKEHDDFMPENDPTPKMRDAFLTGAAARAEHYEIAGYTGLVNQARALGEREAVTLLQENLKQEKEALKKVETISKRLLKESNGSVDAFGSTARVARAARRAQIARLSRGRRAQRSEAATASSERLGAVSPARRAMSRAPSLASLRREAATCTRCPLYANATQTVFGEGRSGDHARGRAAG